MNLKNKVALIMGGARMGQALASALASRGADCVISYRRSKKSAQKIARDLRGAGQKAWIISCDASKEKDVKKMMRKIESDAGRLDILINLTSTYEATPWNRLSLQDWKKQLDNNLTGAFLSVLYAAPLLKKSGGRVIHFSDWVSASGRPHYRGYTPYYAAKSGILGLTQAQALELAPQVLVNTVAPGPILPPAGVSLKTIKEVQKATPLRRWGGTEEIVKAVMFLIDTNFVTGECIRVDGGRHLY